VNQVLRRDNPDPLTVYGSITLNTPVGGINPIAVEAALRTGARLVWMPTVDSQAHAAAFGHTGGWDVQGSASALRQRTPLTILQEGRLIPAAQDVLKLCQERGVALGTGHLGAEEILALVRFASEEKFARLVVTHPLFKVPGLDHATLTALAALGASFEFTYCTISPLWRHATIDQTVAAIRAVGIERAYLTSDGGQTHNPMPHEGLRLLAQMCLEKGLSETDVSRLIRDNPARLIES
jgi:hypothetical protein